MNVAVRVCTPLALPPCPKPRSSVPGSVRLTVSVASQLVCVEPLASTTVAAAIVVEPVSLVISPVAVSMHVPSTCHDIASSLVGDHDSDIADARDDVAGSGSRPKLVGSVIVEFGAPPSMVRSNATLNESPSCVSSNVATYAMIVSSCCCSMTLESAL